MGKLNEIQEQTTQSYGDNSFTTSIKVDTVEFDSLKDKFTFKDPIEVPGLKINGTEIATFSAEDKAKLDSLQTPMQVKGRVDGVRDLPTEGVKVGHTYLVGLSGAENFEEYVCVEVSGSPATPVWENLGHVKTQSNWNQSNSSADDYIKNKPAIKAGQVVNSIIEGNLTGNSSTGNYSHAEGNGTTASGPQSHAEGGGTTASGNLSHAEGGSTTASGVSSHAEGGGTKASGPQSHAEGSGTKASGNYSHTEGQSTTASGYSSHAEGGGGTTASGDNSHAEGGGTTASGDNSHAEGGGTTASGLQSHTEGGGTTASGESSHAEGLASTASGNYSHAEGGGTKASGDNSHAEGGGTTASGSYSHAEGINTTAKNSSQHVFGENNVLDPSTASSDARGTYVEIVGNGANEDTRSNARTLDWAGNETLAGNLTIGGTITANGQQILPQVQADWNQTTNTGSDYIKNKPVIKAGQGVNSIIEGDLTENSSTGNYSHTEGVGTTASGIAAHTEGVGTTASGTNSHAEGYNTTANHKCQHVFGEFNTADPSAAASDARGTYIEIVGKGADEDTRSNARTLDWGGNEVLAGTLTIGGASGATLKVEGGVLKVSLDGGTTWLTVSAS